MATIVIKDLPESMELDRAAMRAITGGSRFRTGNPVATRPVARRVQIFDLSRSKSLRPPPAP
jgi:hypothetical protein